jgi:hypothetical protein
MSSLVYPNHFFATWHNSSSTSSLLCSGRLSQKRAFPIPPHLQGVFVAASSFTPALPGLVLESLCVPPPMLL